jgi:very-short-patch-repair endonuclease
MKRPKVYLAGKIAKNGWRNEIVPEPGPDWYDGGPDEPWGRRGIGRRAKGIWPIRVGTEYDITGPFFVRDDHGCTHGQSSHANGGGCVGDFGGRAFGGSQSTKSELIRASVRIACLHAIQQSDFVYAWVDDPTAHGTFAEIGYAIGAGIPVHVATPRCQGEGERACGCGHCWECERDTANCCPYHGDMWFPTGMAEWGWYADNPVQGFRAALGKWREGKREFDSEVERLFWEAHESLGRPIPDLDNQWDIKANGKQYRLDFYSPARRAAIEVDGLAHHNGQASFISDRNRQRDLEIEGVRFLRFAAKEVMVDAQACVRQAAAWSEQLTRFRVS